MWDELGKNSSRYLVKCLVVSISINMGPSPDIATPPDTERVLSTVSSKMNGFGATLANNVWDEMVFENHCFT